MTLSPRHPGESERPTAVVAIGENCVLRARDGLALAELDGETVVLDQDYGVVHVLNATATLVWTRCDGSTTLREIISALAQSFGTDRRVVGDDVMALASVLVRRGLLEQPAADGGH